jgi:hypothetical protein
MEEWMNRRFEVHQYRAILLHMRQGESDRKLAESRLIGRQKAKTVRTIAQGSSLFGVGKVSFR